LSITCAGGQDRTRDTPFVPNGSFCRARDGVFFRIVRFSHPNFARAVVAHLDSARYRPATIGGCTVKQLV
jgi:hypothetical protein